MKKMKNQKNKLLLHTCCADCVLKFLSSIGKDHEVSLFFDNSNIHPRSEYLARLEAVKFIAVKQHLKLIVPDWSPQKWFNALGIDQQYEPKTRCPNCWNLRILNTSNYAIKNWCYHDIFMWTQ